MQCAWRGWRCFPSSVVDIFYHLHCVLCSKWYCAGNNIVQQVINAIQCRGPLCSCRDPLFFKLPYTLQSVDRSMCTCCAYVLMKSLLLTMYFSRMYDLCTNCCCCCCCVLFAMQAYCFTVVHTSSVLQPRRAAFGKNLLVMRSNTCANRVQDVGACTQNFVHKGCAQDFAHRTWCRAATAAGQQQALPNYQLQQQDCKKKTTDTNCRNNNCGNNNQEYQCAMTTVISNKSSPLGKKVASRL